MAFWFCCGKASNRRRRGKEQHKWLVFSLKEKRSATNNFYYDNKLGEGGIDSVYYWGQLWNWSQIKIDLTSMPSKYYASQSQLVRDLYQNSYFDFLMQQSFNMMKRLEVWSNKVEMEFTVELEIFARIRHKNLLSFRGYCAEGHERLIAYGDWKFGATKYLHHQATPHIIHRDIKANNVYLDSDFQARIGGFRFAKLIPDGAIHVSTEVKGTLSYLAPEYAMLGKANEGCDVYSFGILFLELASGRRPVEKLSSTVKQAMVDLALPLVCEKKFSELAYPRLNGNYVEEELKRVVFVALICAQVLPGKRPTMLDVVELLKGESKDKFSHIEINENEITRWCGFLVPTLGRTG
uniref:Protein kinase domain-containing protein n=1 Tax=Glycine max TaxID=3847 RepID=A0A0R0IYK7_SOYBN